MLTLALIAGSAAAATASPPDLQWLYILIPALFGGYGIATIISHFTKRKTDSESHKLEGTRLGQDIMERALIRLDNEVKKLQEKDELREREHQHTESVNAALIRYLTKLINSIKAGGGTVPLVDAADAPLLPELSDFAKIDNTHKTT